MKTFVSRACGSLLVGTVLAVWPAFATEQPSESAPEGLPEVAEPSGMPESDAPVLVEAGGAMVEDAPVLVEAGGAMVEDAPVLVGPIARALFTRGVQDREPVDLIEVVAADVGVLVFFTELSGLAGSRVEHRWVSEGRMPLELAFDVGADHWRLWTQRTLSTGESGPWTVEVRVDGEVLDRFTVGR
jgi:hypothetical protein